MFRRRRDRSLSERAREWVWPSGGWGRAARYIGMRVARMKGTPYSIAAGFASGAAMSMTPFMGLHFLLSAGLAWLVRGNLISSAIGTVVGNPWTFPLIWLWIYFLGNQILGLSGEKGAPADLTLSLLIQHPSTVLLPMMAGSLPTAAVTWVVVFFPLRTIIRAFQARRTGRLKNGSQQPADARGAGVLARSGEP